MDQTRIAGIGNIYSDEILFQAGLHPLRRVGDLGHEELASLHRTMRKVLRTAIARRLMAEGPASAFPDEWLAARREKGGVCPRCAATLATVKIAGRTCYLCPRCQPEQSHRR
jgi:formamidopyrimidine-DNA glycosylase